MFLLYGLRVWFKGKVLGFSLRVRVWFKGKVLGFVFCCEGLGFSLRVRVWFKGLRTSFPSAPRSSERPADIRVRMSGPRMWTIWIQTQTLLPAA